MSEERTVNNPSGSVRRGAVVSTGGSAPSIAGEPQLGHGLERSGRGDWQTGQSVPDPSAAALVLPCSSAISIVSGSDPARAEAARVDVDGRTVPTRRDVDSRAADELRVLALDAIDRGEDDLRITDVDATIVAQIIHHSVAVVVDEDI